jgi:bifunctional ADP-heptose synthase (sugar kinase/adenylyltransferase)
MSHWFGRVPENDRDTLKAAKMVMTQTGARNLIYTRGERGMFLCQRGREAYQAFVIVPEQKRLFDLVSVGDLVTAALVFCIVNGCSLVEATCFAATAAEHGLERRYSKRLDIQSIFNSRPS